MGSTEVLSPEERVERVRMALAEAGYPDARVLSFDFPSHVHVGVHMDDAPRSVVWRSFATAIPDFDLCWPCYDAGVTAENCPHDPLTSPWPSLPSDNQEPEP